MKTKIVTITMVVSIFLYISGINSAIAHQDPILDESACTELFEGECITASSSSGGGSNGKVILDPLE